MLEEKEIKQYGEYRTRRLVLEAWDRLDGVEVGNPDGYQQHGTAVPLKQETISVAQPRPERRPAAVQTQLPASAKPNSPVTPPAKVLKEIDPPTDQPTLSDFGLYKCEVCGKMVMGFEKANHEQEIHGGKGVEWRKIMKKLFFVASNDLLDQVTDLFDFVWPTASAMWRTCGG